jgi:hypothetical protein
MTKSSRHNFLQSSEESPTSDLRPRGCWGSSIHREILREVDLIGPSRLVFTYSSSSFRNLSKLPIFYLPTGDTTKSPEDQEREEDEQWEE